MASAALAVPPELLERGTAALERLAVMRPSCAKSLKKAAQLFDPKISDPNTYVGMGTSRQIYNQVVKMIMESYGALNQFIQSTDIRSLIDGALTKSEGVSNPIEGLQQFYAMALELEVERASIESEDPFHLGSVLPELRAEYERLATEAGRVEMASILAPSLQALNAKGLNNFDLRWKEMSVPRPQIALHVSREIRTNLSGLAGPKRLVSEMLSFGESTTDALVLRAQRVGVNSNRDTIKKAFEGIGTDPRPLLPVLQQLTPAVSGTRIFELLSGYPVAMTKRLLSDKRVQSLTIGQEASDESLSEAFRFLDERGDLDGVKGVTLGSPGSGPLMGVIMRAMADDVLDSPIVFSPRRKKEKFGDLIFVRPYAQVSVWLNSDGSVKDFKLTAFSDGELAGSIPEPEKSSSPGRLSSAPSAPNESVDRQLGSAAIKIQPVSRPQTPLDFPESIHDLPESEAEWFKAFLSKAHEDFPGLNGFWSEAIDILAIYPELWDRSNLSWFASVTRQIGRRLSESQMAKSDYDSAIKDLEIRVERFSKKQERFFEMAARIRKPTPNLPQASNGPRSIEDFLLGSFETTQLSVGKSYEFTVTNQAVTRRVKFEQKAIDFINSQSVPEKWLRALKRGIVSSPARNGIRQIQTVGSQYPYELKVIQDGAHWRLGMRQEADGTWVVVAPFDTIR